jgi:hypothetical protein
MATIGWAPIGSPEQAVQLQSPYIANDSHLIRPSQDFTVRYTTISRSILSDYGDLMLRGRFGNDYFCVMSHFGIGSGGENKSSLAMNHVTRESQVNSDILSFWGENIRFIQDYRDLGTNGNAGRIYIGTSCFCQSLGKSSIDNLREAHQQVSQIIGRFAPWLTPYTTVGSLAVDGVLSILKKIIDHKSECVESSLSLFPGSLPVPLPRGDAYLQLGSYVFLFDQMQEKINIEELFLTREGTVVKRANSPGKIPPYVVINIVDGIQDAPGEVFSKAVAVDILEKYQARYSLNPQNSSSLMPLLLDSLQKIGDAYHYISRIDRYKELLAKGSKRSEKETARMSEIRKEIEAKFPQVKLSE